MNRSFQPSGCRPIPFPFWKRDNRIKLLKKTSATEGVIRSNYISLKYLLRYNSRGNRNNNLIEQRERYDAGGDSRPPTIQKRLAGYSTFPCRLRLLLIAHSRTKEPLKYSIITQISFVNSEQWIKKAININWRISFLWSISSTIYSGDQLLIF